MNPSISKRRPRPSGFAGKETPVAPSEACWSQNRMLNQCHRFFGCAATKPCISWAVRNNIRQIGYLPRTSSPKPLKPKNRSKTTPQGGIGGPIFKLFKLETNRPGPERTMIPECRHIEPNGHKCKSPSLRDGVFCCFHARLYGGFPPETSTRWLGRRRAGGDPAPNGSFSIRNGNHPGALPRLVTRVTARLRAPESRSIA